MELIKKTTILFPPDLHAHLRQVAKQQGTSLGQLVRSACEKQYGYQAIEARYLAVEALSQLLLPVGSTSEMKQESMVKPQQLLP